MHGTVTLAQHAAPHHGQAYQALAMMPALVGWWLLPAKARLDRQRRKMLRWEDRRFDRSLGIDASGEVRPSEAGVVGDNAPEGLLFRAQPVRLTRWLLAALPRGATEFTFIDMGSGKGRACFVAAERGFKRIVGVEFQRDLHEQAVVNLAEFERRAAQPSRIVPLLQDAAVFEFPDDEPLVVHFANPFSEKVMAEVIANLTASYERRPRPLFALYLQARTRLPGRDTRNVELLAAAAPFERHRALPQHMPTQRVFLHSWRGDLFESREAIAFRRR